MVKRIKKPRPPRLYIDEKGRYIKLNGKKVYIKSTMSNKQLVKVVVNNFQKRRRYNKRQKKAIKKDIEDLEKINKSQANDLAKVMFSAAVDKNNRLQPPSIQYISQPPSIQYYPQQQQQQPPAIQGPQQQQHQPAPGN